MVVEPQLLVGVLLWSKQINALIMGIGNIDGVFKSETNGQKT